MKRRDFIFSIANGTLLILFSLFCLLPMVLVLMVSVTDEVEIIKNGYSFFPKAFSLAAYKMAFAGGSSVLRSLLISVVVTVAGTVAAVGITAMAGYVLANKMFKMRGAFSLFFFITMVFNAGIVPWYIVCTKLGMRDNLLALIIPSLVFNPFNLFLCRNYMKELPDSIMESALIDGAHHGRILASMYLPLSKPVLATIALFYGIAYWNNWFNAIMLVDNEKIYPLQYMLFKLKSYMTMVSELQQGAGSSATPPSESFKMATSIITVGPIILFYPYLQRYIVKGLVIGSVKG